MARRPLGKVQAHWWLRPHVKDATRQLALAEQRNENEQAEILIAESLRRRGVLAEHEPPNPQSRTRRAGRVRKAAAPLVLAALIGGSASQVHADSKLSTFVAPRVVYSVDWKKRRQWRNRACILPVAA